jgi:hypothetical protein
MTTRILRQPVLGIAQVGFWVEPGASDADEGPRSARRWANLDSEQFRSVPRTCRRVCGRLTLRQLAVGPSSWRTSDANL